MATRGQSRRGHSPLPPIPDRLAMVRPLAKPIYNGTMKTAIFVVQGIRRKVAAGYRLK